MILRESEYLRFIRDNNFSHYWRVIDRESDMIIAIVHNRPSADCVTLEANESELTMNQVQEIKEFMQSLRSIDVPKHDFKFSE